jgi:hypothetical protein
VWAARVSCQWQRRPSNPCLDGIEYNAIEYTVRRLIPSHRATNRCYMRATKGLDRGYTGA